MLGDRHLAEDNVQETLIRAWHHADRLLCVGTRRPSEAAAA
jgi:RNA polymerase sigma-70 factor (ECF subfamily)